MSSEIYIVGADNLQNQLMALAIQKETDYFCACIKDKELKSIFSKQGENQKILILLDCMQKPLANLWVELSIKRNNTGRQIYFGLFNVKNDEDYEFEGIKRDIAGIFQDTDFPELFIKGIDAILNGELWFSRKALIQFIQRSKGISVLNNSENSSRTQRETEVLKLVTTGQPNKEIADELCISGFTVKAHLNNIFNMWTSNYNTSVKLCI